jgi:peptide/nickel transport system ATP-binding protein
VRKSLSISIRSGRRTLVDIADYPVFENEIAFLFGESGIGKSILSKAVYGLMDPSEISVRINGKNYPAWLDLAACGEVRKNSFFVFQEPSSHLHPLIKIADQLNEGSLASSADGDEILRRLWQTEDRTLLRRIIDIFPKPFRPSGGEKQRVLLAMAFKKIMLFRKNAAKTAPSFFVFDEPTGSLDNRYRDLFLKLLFEQYRARPFTILIITHDYSIISEMAKSHGDLSGLTRFLELSRTGESTVRADDFSPGQYLAWLNQSNPAPGQRPDGPPILDVQPDFRIFGRALRITRDNDQGPSSRLVIGKGEMAYVKAGSGVGKTTLAKIILGLYRADKFTMTLCGLRVDQSSPDSLWQKEIFGKKAGMVFQHADEALDPECTVAETFRGLPRGPGKDREAVKKTLSGLFDGPLDNAFLDKKVKYLSGGQKQRLNILRTLALETDLVILDEPLNGLDFVSVRKVLDLVSRKQASGTAFLMISHNEEIFDKVVGREKTYFLSES